MSQNDRIELQAMAILRRRVKKLSIASEKAPQTYGWVFSLMWLKLYIKDFFTNDWNELNAIITVVPKVQNLVHDSKRCINLERI